MENRHSHRFFELYPITKATFVLLFITLSFVLPDYIFRYSLLFIYFAISIYSGISRSYVKFIFGMSFLVFFVFLIQILFKDGSTILYHSAYLVVTQESLEKAANLTSLILAISSAVFIFFKTTDVSEFIIALEKKGFSRQAAFLLLSTLQIIPVMNKQSKVIMNAQKARGVETEGNLSVRIKAFLPILFPLIKSALTNTTEKALTLEARAFSSHHVKTFISATPDNLLNKSLRLLNYLIIVGLIITKAVITWLI